MYALALRLETQSREFQPIPAKEMTRILVGLLVKDQPHLDDYRVTYLDVNLQAG